MCRSVVKSILTMLKPLAGVNPQHHIFKREQLEEKTGLRLFDLEGGECGPVVESTHIQIYFFQKIFSKPGMVVHA